MFQKQNETKRNFVTRRGSGKNWSAGSLVERTVARDARCPAVRAARFPTGFFRVDAHFFFDRRAMLCDTRPWLIVMQMIFAQQRKRLATWTCSIYVHVHGKKIPERPRVSPTSFSAYLGSCLLACSSSLSFSYRLSYPNSSSSLYSRHCPNILVSILVIYELLSITHYANLRYEENSQGCYTRLRAFVGYFKWHRVIVAFTLSMVYFRPVTGRREREEARQRQS